MATHYIKFKNPDEIDLYTAIKEGRKTVEGRVNSSKYRGIAVGDTLKFWAREGILCCTVTYINRFPGIEDYINKEGVRHAIGIHDVSIEDALKMYYSFNKKEKVEKLAADTGTGFLGIGIRFEKEASYHMLHIQPIWFNNIKSGKKIAEGRPGKEKIRKMIKGDYLLILNTEGVMYTRITDAREYKSFYEMLDTLGLENVLPGIKTLEDGVGVYRQWYSEEMEKKLGVYAIFIGVLNVL